jgi:hypothetical protein
MSQTVASTLVEALEKIGVTHIFGLISDSLNPIGDVVRRSKIEWVGVRAPVHLLILFEEGARGDGVTSVEGLPRSGLRNYKGKLVLVPADHEYYDWQKPSRLTQAAYFYFDPAVLPPESETGHADVSLPPRLFFEDQGLWDIAIRLKALVEGPDASIVSIANLSASCSPMNSCALVRVELASSLQSGVASPAGSNTPSLAISRSTSPTRSRSPPSPNSLASVRTISAGRSSRRSACRRIDSTRTVASSEPSLC